MEKEKEAHGISGVGMYQNWVLKDEEELGKQEGRRRTDSGHLRRGRSTREGFKRRGGVTIPGIAPKPLHPRFPPLWVEVRQTSASGPASLRFSLLRALHWHLHLKAHPVPTLILSIPFTQSVNVFFMPLHIDSLIISGPHPTGVIPVSEVTS